LQDAAVALSYEDGLKTTGGFVRDVKRNEQVASEMCAAQGNSEGFARLQRARSNLLRMGATD